MWICRKCNTQVASAGKICRACGSILDEVTDDSPQAETASAHILQDNHPGIDFNPALANDPDSAGEPPVDVEPAGPDWKCPNCGEIVPGIFEVCWKCMTTKAGEPPPNAQDLVPHAGDDEEEVERTPLRAIESSDGDWLPIRMVALDEPKPDDRRSETNEGNALRCRSCGATKVIRNVTVMDAGDGNDGTLKAMIVGNPEALFFKDRLYGQILADICGACGHMDLRLANPDEFYKHFVKSSKQMPTRPSNDMLFPPETCQKCRMEISKGSATCPYCGAGQNLDD